MHSSASETFAIPDETNSARIVQSAIQRSSQLATLPAVVVEIIRLCDNPDSNLPDLNNVIVLDPVLAARILKLVNSPFYGLSGQINSINRALLQLGLQAVKNIAIATSLVKLVRGGLVCPDFNAGDLWTHSVAVATGAQMLARQSGRVAVDAAFLGGLVHDMGIVVEMQALGPAFVQVIQKVVADENLTFRTAEEKVLGASHEAFGSGLCQAWNFPASLQIVAGYHHRPWEIAEADRRLPALVHIADVLAARIGSGYRRTVETDSIDPQLLSCANLTESDVDTVAGKLTDAVRVSQGLLSDGR